MNKIEIFSSPKIIRNSILINIFFCWLVLPLLLQPTVLISPGQFLETFFWQALGLVTWPVTLTMALVNPFFSRTLPRLSDIFRLILYPLIEISLLMILILKNNKWILLILIHILLLITFSITWNAVLNGYNFMVG